MLSFTPITFSLSLSALLLAVQNTSKIPNMKCSSAENMRNENENNLMRNSGANTVNKRRSHVSILSQYCFCLSFSIRFLLKGLKKISQPTIVRKINFQLPVVEVFSIAILYKNVFLSLTLSFPLSYFYPHCHLFPVDYTLKYGNMLDTEYKLHK